MKQIKFHFKRTKKGRRIQNVIFAWVLVILAVVLVLYLGIRIFLLVGKNGLFNNANSDGPTFSQIDWDAEEGEQNLYTTPEKEEEKKVWQEGWIRYNGEVYEYNKDIMTFLFLGIDKNNTVGDLMPSVYGGQSDAIFLLVTDSDSKEIKVIGVNRDTMVDINAVGMGPDGEDVTVQAQITTQHGFGGGKEYSCELTRDAVSTLFYDLPIHGYASFNMAGIAELNDALGGIELTMPEDYSSINKAWKKDATVTLKGNNAYDFIHYRDTKEFESARGRLERQKLYLGSFAKAAIAATKKDLTFPITMYTKMSKYMVTDISIDEVGYLASELIDYHFDSSQIYTMEGVTIMGNGFEQFYPDKSALRELIIKTFYRKVDL